MAHATLTELLPSVSLPEMATATYPADTTDPDDHADNDSDLLYLYDRITSSEQSPVFVAADLNILPLQLITDKDDSKSELLREIRQLKRFIQDALNGRVDEPPITQADRYHFLPPSLFSQALTVPLFHLIPISSAVNSRSLGEIIILLEMQSMNKIHQNLSAYPSDKILSGTSNI